MHELFAKRVSFLFVVTKNWYIFLLQKQKRFLIFFHLLGGIITVTIGLSGSRKMITGARGSILGGGLVGRGGGTSSGSCSCSGGFRMTLSSSVSFWLDTGVTATTSDSDGSLLTQYLRLQNAQGQPSHSLTRASADDMSTARSGDWLIVFRLLSPYHSRLAQQRCEPTRRKVLHIDKIMWLRRLI